MSNNQYADIPFETRLDNVRRGKYSFRELYSFELKDQMEEALLKDLKDGSITDKARCALIQYYCDSIRNKRFVIDRVPEELRDEVSKHIEKQSKLIPIKL